MAKTERNNKVYEDYKDGMKPAALGRKYGFSRQYAEQIIHRIAEQRGEELRDMGRKKIYDAVFPVTPATAQKRLFMDAYAKYHSISISDAMRLCVDKLEASQSDKDRKEIEKIEKKMFLESMTV